MRLRQIQQTVRQGDLLRWEHLEPHFADKVAQASAKSQASQASNRASIASNKDFVASDAASTLVAAAIALMLVTLYVSVVFHLAGPGLTLLLIASPIALGATTRVARRRQAARLHWPRVGVRLRGPIPADSVALFDAADLTPTERRYADLLALVAQTPAASVAARDRRLLVREASALLAHWTRLESQRAHLRRVTAPEDAPSHSADADYAATVRALEPLTTRIDAHQEAIRQALHFAHAALAYRVASAETLAPPPVETLYRVALRLAAETDAVENAVRELNSR